jgi:1-deoxy-D-xylulose-5-phosphate synthase
MPSILPRIHEPADLLPLSDEQLLTLAQEIRDELIRVLTARPAHFASNLGVVELCLALHLAFDFRRDRLIWDTGHQIYPHKLITGRYEQFQTIRTRGGLMGFPNPAESEFDLFVTGHAGASVSTISGLKAGDELLGESRHAVAVIGDGALPCGMVFEAFNNIAGLNQDVLVVLNDNKMGICPRTGGLAQYLDQFRMTGLYQGGKRTLNDILKQIPLVGETARASLESLRDGMKAYFKDGMLFEEFGFRYFGPFDGHDLLTLRKTLKDLKGQKGPILLHVFTTKGEGVPQAEEDPVTYHAPAVFEKLGPDRRILAMKKGGSNAYTDAMSAAIFDALAADPKTCVLTAAMCQGNKLEKVREAYPKQFFDTGICESHAVAFAAGMAKAGAKPIVNIYSTFLQRSFDQIFQEVCLQNLPVVFTLDRAGLAGPDGPTHHGAFDVPYLRLFPNMTSMAPGDDADVAPMLQFALKHAGPISIRYPKANLERIDRSPSPITLGMSETIRTGDDGAIIVFGALMPMAVAAADRLKHEDGLEIAVVNARFVKPIDRAMIARMASQPILITLEEGTLEGGFGSAVLECLNSLGESAVNVIRKGLPDRFIDHGERVDLLAEHGISVDALVAAIRDHHGIDPTAKHADAAFATAS